MGNRMPFFKISLSHEKLEAAASEFLYQAHDQALADITDCDHLAGVCWCDYHLALVNLRNILNKGGYS
jgi:hypothetical protein